MQIKIIARNEYNYEYGMGDTNLDEYRYVYPKRIMVDAECLSIDELVEISELYDSSIFSFNKIYVDI